jgi:hypothetical protein
VSKRCIHEDDDGRCQHVKLMRIGRLAAVFGEHPACVLIGAADAACGLRELEPEHPAIDPENIWARLAASE